MTEDNSFRQWYDTFEILDTLDVNWDAVEAAREWWYDQFAGVSRAVSGRQAAYRQWMANENGIDHGNTYIKIVDKEKYTLFLLKWA